MATTGTGVWYGNALVAAFAGELEVGTDTLKMALVDDSFTPDQTDTDWSDVSAAEVSGDGYTAGGATLAGVTAGFAGGVFTIDCNDVTWPESTITASAAVIYDDTAGDALLGYILFDSEVSSVDGDFTVEIDSDGLLSATLDLPE